MTLKKPSDIFGKKPEDLNIKIVEKNNSLHDELVKVENLSDQIIQLQQELSQKVIQSDLEELFSSQINNIQENFENLQNDFKKSNKRDIKNFNELKDIVSNTINDVKEEVYNIVGLLSNNLEEYSKELSNIRADVIINEHHINSVNKYFKDGVFSETEKLTSNNLKNNIVRLEKKIDFIRETYSKIEPEVIIREAINQGLLNEPPDTNNSDPLTPLDKNFVTLEQLQQHYRLFLNRIQQQMSTIGGGGETRLKYLDDIVGISTNSSSYDQKFLKYDHSIQKFIFSEVSSSTSGIATYASNAGIATYATSAGIATYASNAGIATFATSAGIATYASNAGIATYATSAGIATYATSAGIATYASNAGIATYATSAGIATYASNAGIATYASNAGIATYATSAGIATYASNAGIATYASNAGIATYATSAGIATYASNAGIATNAQGLTGTPNLNVGIITATSFVGSGTNLTGIVTSIVAGTNVTISGSTGQVTINASGGSSSQFVTTAAGIHTLSNVGIGTTNPTSALTVSGDVKVTGIITASSFSGNATSATYATSAGIATYSSNAGIATYSSNAGIATYASNAGIATFATSAGIATYASNAGIATYSSNAGIATYSSNAGIATFATSAGIATYASNAGIATYSSNAGIATFATSAGIATNAQGLTGTPNLNVGIVTATSFVGDGSFLTGIVGSGSGIVVKDSGSTVGTAGTIDFGDNLTVSAISAGIVTVTGSASGGSGIGLSISDTPPANTTSYPLWYSSLIGRGFVYYDDGSSSQWVDFSPSSIAISAGIATYATNAGIATYATNAGIATYATSSGIATNAQGLTGTPNLNVGIITATSFVGNGSGLTNLVGVSAGIVIKDSGSTVGTAGTIDFGDNLTVSAISAGIVTVTGSASGGGSSQFVTTAAGIHTLSNVGIGTTNPTSKLTVSGDALINGLTVGRGGSAEITNTAIGSSALSSNTTGSDNVANGYNALRSNTTADGNVANGANALLLTTNGSYNVAIGNGSLFSNTTGNFNTATGRDTLNSNTTSSNNNATGNSALYYNTGNTNVAVGAYAGQYITTGSKNTILGSYTGNQNGLDIRTSSNNVVLSDGDGNIRFYANSSGNVGLGTTNPKGTLQVGTGITMYGSTGIISATTFYGNVVGNISGSITDATNLTGGYANASQLNVSGVTTISQGRIQADGSSNLRFGNLAAGSGSGRNIAIGDQVLYSLSSGQGRNIGIGELSYYDTTSGQYNIGLGIQAGQKITTGNYNVILGGYDGQTGLDIRTSSNNVVIADGQGNIRQYINSSGNVGIKTTVITEALTVAGIVSATSFYGTLNAGHLTGSLPAIDGSALIGVVGSGSGIIIEEDGTPVGTAGTINFGSNINVAFASGIATVSGSGLATYANVAGIATYATTAGVSTTSGTANYATNAGVSTTSGTAGYATTAGISSTVSGTININTTGIITASSFSGSGSGLTNLPAAQLTGTLPAIDGSALLNVTAAGTGIAVRDDNASVGSATTVNFGTGLDVTFSAGIATITASGGSLQSRTTVSGVTTSIANLGIGNTNITGFKSYALMKVGLSTTGWLRLYTDSTSRANDVSRSVGEDPAPGSGVIAEVVTTGISTTQIISPFVMGGNLDNSPTTTIYAAITNLSGTTQAITANLTILQLEA